MINKFFHEPLEMFEDCGAYRSLNPTAVTDLLFGKVVCLYFFRNPGMVGASSRVLSVNALSA